MVQLLAIEAAAGGGELHGPQEVRDGLEVRSNSENFVNDIFNAIDSNVAKGSLDNVVGAERNTLARDLAIATLVDQLTDRLQVRISVSNEGLNKSEHLDGGTVDANEHTVVDLAKSQQLEDLLDLGGHTDDTTNSDDEDKLLLRRNVDLVVSLGLAAVVDSILLELLHNEEN